MSVEELTKRIKLVAKGWALNEGEELALRNLIKQAQKQAITDFASELKKEQTDVWDKIVIDRATKLHQPAPSYKAIPLDRLNQLKEDK